MLFGRATRRLMRSVEGLTGDLRAGGGGVGSAEGHTWGGEGTDALDGDDVAWFEAAAVAVGGGEGGVAVEEDNVLDHVRRVWVQGWLSVGPCVSCFFLRVSARERSAAEAPALTCVGRGISGGKLLEEGKGETHLPVTVATE